MVRDNDGEPSRVSGLYEEYAGQTNINIYIDPDASARTLEPQLLKSNGREKLIEMLNEEFASDDDLESHMTANKTSVALKLYEHEDELVIPDYLQDAIG